MGGTMKRWVLLTVFLYVIVISILVAPILYFMGEGDREAYFGTFFLLFVPILMAIQAVLLLVPVAVARERPVKRRAALTSAVVGALPMALLLTCFVWFIFNMLLGEDASGGPLFEWGAPALLGILWLFWGALFFRSFTAADPGSLTSTITKWLLKGSILEILIAIPAHILSRHRNECCAPGFTLFGLVTGISVAVMAFGPGIFFLFARKVREKRMAKG